MGFLDRAKSMHGRGEAIRAAFILAEGLKREPSNGEALEWLLHLYVDELPNAGMEREVLTILDMQPNGVDLFEIVLAELKELSRDNKVDALEEVLDRYPQLLSGNMAPPPQAQQRGPVMRRPEAHRQDPRAPDGRNRSRPPSGGRRRSNKSAGFDPNGYDDPNAYDGARPQAQDQGYYDEHPDDGPYDEAPQGGGPGRASDGYHGNVRQRGSQESWDNFESPFEEPAPPAPAALPSEPRGREDSVHVDSGHDGAAKSRRQASDGGPSWVVWIGGAIVLLAITMTLISVLDSASKGTEADTQTPSTADEVDEQLDREPGTSNETLPQPPTTVDSPSADAPTPSAGSAQNAEPLDEAPPIDEDETDQMEVTEP